MIDSSKFNYSTIPTNEQSELIGKASQLSGIRHDLTKVIEHIVQKSVNVILITQINGRFLFLSVLSLRLPEECGRPYQLGTEGGRGLLAHSASNKFITPPSVKQPNILTLFYFHAISRI